MGALRYAGREAEALKAIAQSAIKRSLAQFQKALVDFQVELVEDPIIKAHLESLYDTMLEQNLCRIIEPYSRVQVSHVARVIALPVDQVEKKLSQMILDRKLSGILDHETVCSSSSNPPVQTLRTKLPWKLFRIWAKWLTLYT